MKKLTLTDFQRFGLSDKEAAVYTSLLEHGESSVAEVSTRTRSKKGNTYNLLTSLITQGLVEQSQQKPKACFRVTDPSHFRKLLQKQHLEAQENASLLETLLPHLVSTYTATTHAPSVEVHEGIEGIATHYRKVLQEKPKEILLIRSKFDHSSPEVDQIVNSAVAERHAKKIFTRIIGPAPSPFPQDFEAYNRLNSLDRHFTASTLLTNLPAQIQIWNDNVAISSLQKPYLVSTIKNTAIAQTFRNIFEFMWTQTAAEHEAITKQGKQ
jgi:sugar-specific transcriptional regulator TrmB